MAAVPPGGSERDRGCPCSEAIDHVWDLLDGEMEPGDCDRIRRHLEACSGCRTEYEREAALKDRIARACACERAPTALREWVSRQVAVWRFDIGTGDTISGSRVEIRRETRETRGI